MATTNVSTGRQEALSNVLKQIDKSFGEGTVMRLGDKPKHNVETFSTGSLELDAATGIGGFPRGRIAEIYAQESVGKTTLALHAIADCQRKGGTAAIVDAEHALDPSYARKLGVDLDQLLISQPTSGEQALEIVDRLILSGAVDFIVVDSVAALVPQAELDGEMSDLQVGLQARMMSKAMRKVTGSVAKTNTGILFINQLRDKIGAMGYGDPSTTTGGKALKFYASLRIKLARTGSTKSGTEVVANNIKAKIEKNKLAPPFKIAEFDIRFSEGISREAQILSLGDKFKMVKKSGSFYRYIGDGDDIQMGQGQEAAIQFLKDNAELRDKIWAELVEIYSKTYVGYEESSSEESDGEETTD